MNEISLDTLLHVVRRAVRMCAVGTLVGLVGAAACFIAGYPMAGCVCTAIGLVCAFLLHRNVIVMLTLTQALARSDQVWRESFDVEAERHKP